MINRIILVLIGVTFPQYLTIDLSLEKCSLIEHLRVPSLASCGHIRVRHGSSSRLNNLQVHFLLFRSNLLDWRHATGQTAASDLDNPEDKHQDKGSE